MINKSLQKNAFTVAIVMILLVVPLLIRSNYLYSIMIVIALYSIIGQGLGILMGYAGQISFGHAAFYGLGGYTAAILTTRYSLPALPALLAAVLLPGIVALLMGKPILKLRELYLALATLGFGILAHILFSEGQGLTGGPSGISGIPRFSFAGFVIDNDQKFYIMVWLIILGLLIGIRNLIHSRIGRALCAIRESEYAAENAGIDCAALKLQAFVFSAALAGLAGGLYAFYVTFVSPSPFSFQASVQFVLMVVVGGLGTFWGPLLGAAVVVILSEVLREFIPMLIPSAGGEYQIIVYGIILILLMVFRPEGLSSLDGIFERRKKTALSGAVEEEE